MMNKRISGGGGYERFQAREYLEQYYTTQGLAEDSIALIRFLMEKLGQRNVRYRKALDFGCGPVILFSMPVSRYCDEIHLADYLPGNLHEIELWLQQKPEAFNWDGQLAEVASMERTAMTLAERKQQLRHKVKELKLADIRQSSPLADHDRYDLVTSFFCVEAVATTKNEWQQYLKNLANLVEPGGVLVLAAMRHCTAYRVFDQNFPSTSIDENDLAEFLPSLGFNPTTMKIEAVPITTWADHGFDGICLMWAEKTR